MSTSCVQAGLRGHAELSSRSQDFANSLIQMLQDPGTGVASAAASALRAAVSTPNGAPLLPVALLLNSYGVCQATGCHPFLTARLIICFALLPGNF